MDCLRTALAFVIACLWSIICGSVLIDTLQNKHQTKSAQEHAIRQDDQAERNLVRSRTNSETQRQSQQSSPNAGGGEENSELSMDTFLTLNATDWIAWFTVVLAIVAGLQGCIYWQIHSTDRTVRRAWISVRDYSQFQRYDHPSAGAQGPPSNVTFSFVPILINSGATPTVGMTTVVNSEFRATPLPPGFAFPYTGNPRPMLLGPQAVMGTPVHTLTAAQLLAIRNGQGFFYAWGESNYRDVFTNQIHTFKFCVQVMNVLGDPMNLKTERNPHGSDVGYSVFMHDEHNSST